MERADVVVVGAGHNGLVAAAYAAAAGLSVIVLEGREDIGGDTSTEELTLPGFRHDACASAHTIIQSSPLIRNRELQLDRFGLRYIQPEPVFVVPFRDGDSLTMFRSPDETEREIRRLSPEDAYAYRKLLDDWELLAPIQAEERANPPGPPEEVERRWRSGPLGDEGLRIRLASGMEIIEERFRHPKVQAFIAWVATMTLDPIDRPGTGLLPFSLTAGRQRYSWTTPEGGSQALPNALAALVRAAGGRIYTNAFVTAIETEDGRARAVVTADGRRFVADKAIVSSQHFTQLPKALGAAMEASARAAAERWRAGLTMFVTHYALTEPPRYRTHDGDTTAVAMGALGSLAELRTCLAAFRQGRLELEHPFLLVLNSSQADPSRAPAGQATLKIVGVQPYALAEGPQRWDDIKATVSERLFDHYLRYTVNLRREHVLARHVESPLDLERRNPNNFRGSCHGGDNSPSQVGWFRPAPGWSGYRTPVLGLYLTGSTTHPGGSVSGHPGRNAARALLEDLGIPFAQALAGAEALARAQAG